ncbi:hypothetical protein [Desulfonatronum sp. SC1]|uniref:hypothetical protein n=1 Tax=Desulfonatronum sp. SC1 TaxID=2109626 RepID=UPI000D2F740F|nr:hypothetical protein [Desulfonatronum sp. SC1]PTN37862.1 hypothetical protein C6366_04870 [Desulfonatronum sp. SC1]
MAGKIFIRERRKVEAGEKKPRFRIVAVSGADVKFKVEHIRKQEVEEIASAVGAEIVLLKPEKGKSKGENEDEE